ncbi:hypothetical protein FRACYDRAFT_179671 [Fragilariopsis cylindrus CCMP1102]|uniref:Uncharacterized protein n=1 Tax=Fragilariopsis cylindrus CCMP1102 TaxID=635003 RepID=A0A1E7FWN9_9STRA|nr:hypothetical protein FRACYDRAFT_179671 [Fragilariopsis cylindrus CCMP1102]|eukprot:OEU22556.1 hypothetical protein FRACYDRAFT_179671 [Fragilariopsis cylindrus CCMP1102]
MVRRFLVAETFCPTATTTTTTTITTTRIITSSSRCQPEVRLNPPLHYLPFSIKIPSFLHATTATRLAASEGSSFRSEDNKNDDNDDDDGDNTGASSSSSSSSSIDNNIDNNDNNNDDDDDSTIEQYSHEETLLVMNLRPKQQDGDGISYEECLSQISQYIQSFPFVALLPVQPLQYVPTKDGGVEIKFLRKKTVTKSGIEGGVRFFVRIINLQEQQQQRDNDYDTTTITTTTTNEKDNGNRKNNKIIEVTAKRNSEGQTISKMFTEKLLIQGFVSGMTEYDGENKNNSGPAEKVIKTRIESPTKSIANIESIFHKWMR